MMRLITSPCGCREAYLGPTDKACVEWHRCGTHAKLSDVAKTLKAEALKAETDPDEYAYVQRTYTGS